MPPITKVLIAIAAVLAALVVGVFSYVRFADLSIWTDDFENLLSESSGFAITIDGTPHVSIGSELTVSLSNISVANPEWPDPAPVATIDRLFVSVAPWTLLAGPVEITTLNVAGVAVDLRVKEDGRNNWQVETTQADTDDGERPIMHAIRLENIAISYNGGPNTAATNTSVNRLTLLRSETGIHSLDVSGEYAQDAQQIPFNIDGELALGVRQLNIIRTRMDIGDNGVNFDGHLQFDEGQKPSIVAEISAERFELGDTAVENNDSSESKSGRVFSDKPISQSWLDTANAEIQLSIKKLLIGGDELDDVRVSVSLKDGALAIDPVEFTKGDGNASASVSLKPTETALVMRVQLSAKRLRLAAAASSNQDPNTVPPLDLELDILGSGNTWHEIAASSGGHIAGSHHEGQINMQGSGLLFSDILISVLQALNPLSEAEEFANVECSIINVNVENGVATVNELAAQLEKLKIIASGKINLDTEQLDLTMRTKTREGFGVSIGGVVNSFLAIGGTLDEPAVSLDPTGSATTAGAAIATGGLSVLAKGLWDRLSAETNICQDRPTPKNEEN